MHISTTRYRQHLLTTLGLLPAAGALPATAAAAPAPASFEVVAFPPLTGVENRIGVIGATPGALVYLVGGVGIGSGPCPTPVGSTCLDLIGAVVLGSERASASGDVDFSVMIPSTIPDGRTLYLQAVEFRPAARTSSVFSGAASHPTRACGELEEIVPGILLQPFSQQYLLCGPKPSSGFCPAYSNLPWQAVNDQLYRRAGLTPGGGGGYDAVPFCGETSIEDRCCYGVDIFEWVVGRPFLVDGKARVAGAGHDPSWSTAIEIELGTVPAAVRHRLAARWTETALGEHASIASFARFQLQLLQVGAPADLVADTTRAMADEIQHARDAFAIASALAGEVRAPGPMDVAGLRPEDLRDILRAVVREGCIAETIAAAQVSEAAARCSTPALATLLSSTADDERRHAALAWRFVRWALTQHPEHADVLREEVARPLLLADAGPDVDAPWIDRFGLLARADGDRVAHDVFHDVVRPCALSLLASVPAVA